MNKYMKSVTHNNFADNSKIEANVFKVYDLR